MKNTSSHFFRLPRTRYGWWAVGLATASIILILAWSLLPGGAWLGFICGLAGGIIALNAVTRQQERSILTFLSILPLFWVLMFFLGEFLIPH